MIFISAEGTETEPSYFGHIDNCLRQNQKCPFALHVLRHDADGDSDPEHVLQLIRECRALRKGAAKDGSILSAREFMKIGARYTQRKIDGFMRCPETLSPNEKRELKEACFLLGLDVRYRKTLAEMGGPGCEDAFAIVIDRDIGNHAKETLEGIRKACDKEKILFCLSNPCFDFWLLLHLKLRITPTMKGKLIENKYVSDEHTYTSGLLAEKAGHKKTILGDVFNKMYRHNIKSAVEKAAKFETHGTGVIESLGTGVPVLVKRLLPWL